MNRIHADGTLGTHGVLKKSLPTRHKVSGRLTVRLGLIRCCVEILTSGLLRVKAGTKCDERARLPPHQIVLEVKIEDDDLEDNIILKCFSQCLSHAQFRYTLQVCKINLSSVNLFSQLNVC